ncbi:MULTISPECIES: acetylglutamate kinase [unclassified Streptomyces]|uniref:acetylglutamate kinase n=1 Tax=unclassified Streptomyces TaxID=2593676 RepID=UPI0035DB4D11
MSAPPSPLLPAPAPPPAPPSPPPPAAPCSCSSTPAEHTERTERTALSKARVLAEALPWLARHRGRTVVIKFGGNAMVDARLKAAFAQDVLFLLHAGLKPVVVHGGGPQIGAQLDRLGLESRFEAGLRVTTDETMDVVRMVLAGQVQRELVGLLNGHGPHAVGLTGEDARLMTAVRHYAEAGGKAVDIGRVGEVARVDTGIVRTLVEDGRIPVISSVARSEDAKDAAGGGVFNVNADTAAAALAAALGAETLLVLTDVEGVYADWPHGEVVPRMTAAELTALAPRLSAGMIPKAEGCLYAVNNGVRTARVIDGRVEHAVLAQVFTDGGTGTEIVPDHHPAPVPGHGPAHPPGAGHGPPPGRVPQR